VKGRGKRSGDGFWSRLLGQGKGKAKKPAAKAQAPRRAAPAKESAATPAAASPPPRPSPLERSLNEAKAMAGIGRKDPERLANMLSGILAKEREKARQEKERFEEQVWAILKRDEEQEAAEDSSTEPDSPPRV
jgi:hypothetical protein